MLKKLLENFLSQIRQMREQANKNLSGLQPLEQAEAAQQMRWFFDGCRHTAESLGRVVQDAEKLFQDVEKEYAEALKAELDKVKASQDFLAEVQQSLVKEGKVVEKATADSMAEAAKTAAEKAVRDTVASEQAEKKLIEDRRSEAATELASALKAKHGDKAPQVAQEVASAMSEESLKGDGWKAAVATLKERIGKIIGAGVGSASALQEVAKFPTDKNEAFDAHLGRVQEIAESFSNGGKPPRAPLAGDPDEQKKIEGTPRPVVF